MELVSITFVKKCELVEMVYYEGRVRNEDEKEQYLKVLNIKDEKEIPHLHTKLAKKYVYFDSTTGKIKFEYGGVYQTPIFLNNTEAHELGVICRDNIDTNQSFFHFLIAGDFCHEELKKNNKIMTWSFHCLVIEMNTLL